MVSVQDFTTPHFPNWCPGCVLPGTLIHTNPNIISIEKLTVGKHVLGSDGKYHKITEVMSHHHAGKLYKIKSKCFGETTLTHEHPLLIVKREHKKYHNKTFPIVWEEASKIEKGDYLLYPIPKEVNDIHKISLNITKKKKDTRSKTLPLTIKITPEFLRLCGLYIAEGWMHTRLTGRLHAKLNKKTLDLGFNSSYLAEVFAEWFGKGAWNKKIPHFMMSLPIEKQKELLIGLWQGDGYIQLEKHRASYKTASQVLAEQVKMLLLRFGIIPSISVYKAYKNHKQSYSVQIVGERDFILFANLMDIIYIPKPYVATKYSSIIKDDFILLPVRSIEVFNYDGPVYNLEVEKVNSYVSQNAVLHNCGDFGVWAAIKGALVKLGWGPTDFVMVYGIGCHGHMVNFLKSYAFDGLHGRPVPVAEGIKLANKNLNVMIVAGDGDTFGEGTNHLVHAARRNHDMTMIVHDNQVYGLTTGQTAPTAQTGFKTKSTPFGVLEQAVNPLTIALAAGATFVARGFAGDIAYTAELIAKGAAHKGFAFIDVFQPCVTFNHVNTYQWFRERVYKLDESYNSHDKSTAFVKASEIDSLPLGVFYQEERSIYENEIPLIKETALVDLPMINGSLPALLDDFA
ncbi:hypothetical protein HY008_03455 [Candidatus Woesebacteria bacterium]|nr:hypothetical protein [Candidatus Woesebacteria bacterium]